MQLSVSLSVCLSSFLHFKVVKSYLSLTLWSTPNYSPLEQCKACSAPKAVSDEAANTKQALDIKSEFKFRISLMQVLKVLLSSLSLITKTVVMMMMVKNISVKH